MTRLITGTGSYLPARVVTNDELAGIVANFDPEQAGSDLDAWIRRRYGVASRHWSAEGESTGDMATHACRRALGAAGLEAGDIDLIVLSTATSDHVAPHSVSTVQEQLGCDAVFHQLQDACPGFLNGLMVADSLMGNLGYRRALVVAAEQMTHIVDPTDFRMIGLFADGAGAVVLEDLPVEGEAATGPYGFRSFYAGSDGAAGHHLRVPAGGTRRPLTHDGLERGEQYLVSDFREVYAFATRTIRRCVEEALGRAGLEPSAVDRLVPHHASANIIADGLGDAGITQEQVVLSIDHTGNTSSASVPIALDEHVRAGGLEDGHHLLMLALGGGMGWGSTLYRWAGPETIARARAGLTG